MRSIIATVLTCAGLAACGNSLAVPPNYAAIVGMTQTDYAQVKIAAVAYCGLSNADHKACATVASTIAVADPLVAGLTATSAPTTIQAALQDVVVLLSAPLPPGAISAQTQADLTLGLSIVSTALTLSPLIKL